MLTERDVRDFFEGGYREYLPHLSVDCVIFGFHEGELKLLLLQWKHLGQWSLPGGPVRRDETLEAAAYRVLQARTGLHDLFLQQFHTFGTLDRREDALAGMLERMGLPVPDGLWLTDRVVSVGYYALVDFSQATPAADFFSEACRWWDLDDRPPLLFDHDRMVRRAREALRQELQHRPIGANLLPEAFTMPELQRLYEAVLGAGLDRRNFQRKMLGLGLLERLGKRKGAGPHRAPYLYRFDHEAYTRALREGLALRL